MIKKSALLFLTLLFLLSCRTSKLTTEINISKLGNPPGTIEIADNLYLDQTDIRNVDYLEFLYWTKVLYGQDSYEYTSIYPDTSFWRQLNKSYTSLDSNYLTHPTFRHNCVLGVSNQQARKYSKWRSDRVMEFILIRYGILEYKTPKKGDSPFTIEKYFKGEYGNVKPSPNIPYYPEYKLLDTLENTKTGFKNYCTYKRFAFPLSVQTKTKLLTIYEIGMWVQTDSCTVNLNRQYGFTTVESGSCMPPRGGQARHNNKVEKQLNKRNGDGWRIKYNAEHKRCENN